MQAQLADAWELMRLRKKSDNSARDEWYAAALAAALRFNDAMRAEQLAEAVLAHREAELRHAESAHEAAQERVSEQVAWRGAVEGAVAERDREQRLVAQERAAGTFSPENLTALRSIMGSAGMLMRDAPAPTVLTFLTETFIPDQRLAEDNRRHLEGYARMFAKVLGDRPLNEITRTDIQRWVRTLEKVRTTYGKGGRDHHKPIATILKESAGKPTLGAVTIGRHILNVKKLIVAAAREHRFASRDDIEAMFSDLRLGADVPEPKKRRPWPVATIKELLASPTWTGTRSAATDVRKRHEPGGWIHLDAYWWLPVLALHTGARLEELAQLYHEDLKVDADGLPFIHISPSHGRKLKNKNAERAIPLHPFLVELGFLTLFVPGRKGRVWDKLIQAGRPPKWGTQYSEDFTAYRRSVGLYQHLMDFHSFRHTVVTALREAGADEGLVGQLVGHRTDPSFRQALMTDRYTHFSVRSFRDALTRLDWEAQGVDLGPLRRAVAAAGGPLGRTRAAKVMKAI